MSKNYDAPQFSLNFDCGNFHTVIDGIHENILCLSHLIESNVSKFLVKNNNTLIIFLNFSWYIKN